MAGGYELLPLGAQAVPVSLHRVTSLVFPMAVRSGVRVSRDVQVEKVKGVENVLAIRAVRVGFVPTNLAVFGMDGRLYSFNLEYRDSAVVWQYRVEAVGDAGRGLILTGLPADEERLRADARLMEAKRGVGVYFADSLTWIAGRLSSPGAGDFVVGRVRLFTEERKRVKRMAVQQAEVEAVYADWGGGSGKAAAGFALGYRGIVVSRGKRLVLEVAERDGGRVVRVRVRRKEIVVPKKLY